MAIQRVLDAIIERSGLTRTDGHPLYAYKVTPEELQSLRDALQDTLKIHPELRKPEQRAAFCLFGAEWFRLHHEDGAWSWDTILGHGLGLGNYDRKRFSGRVRKVTSDGLRWWKVPPIRTEVNTHYLVTLACQGGLPLKTLRNHSTPLRRFLICILKDHEGFPGESLDSLVIKHQLILPRTLQNDFVIRLAVEIVDAISRLRKNSAEAASTQQTRADYLDRHHPGWKERIPVRIDDPEALKLMLELLDQQEVTPVKVQGFLVTTSLLREGERTTVTRSLNLPPEMGEGELTRCLELPSADKLQPRMTLSLQCGRERRRVAGISRSFDGEKYRLDRIPSHPLRGEDAAGEVSLVVTTGSQEVTTVIVPGGAALPDTPWVFTDDDTHDLIGTGSVRTQRASVLVAIPHQATLQCPEGSAFSRCEERVCDRELIRLSGTLKVAQDDATVRISSKAKDESASLFKLSGRRLTLGPNGSEVWLGVPKVIQCSVDDSHATQTVDRNRFRWKPRAGGAWNAISSKCLGDVLLRAEHDGEVIYQTSLTVFPKSFRFSLHPGVNNLGDVRLKNLGDVTISAAANDNTKVAVSSTSDTHQVSVRVVKDRPSVIVLRVHFATGNHADVSAACPCPGIFLTTASGRVLPQNATVTHQRLSRLHLQVVSPRSQMMQLVTAVGHRVLARINDSGDTGVRELPLSQIQAYVGGILSREGKLDTEVALHIEQPPSATPLFRMKVGEYAGALSKIERADCYEVSIDRAVIDSLGGTVDGVTIAVAPLGSPDQPVGSDYVHRVGETTWHIYHDDWLPGVYLITAWIDELTCLRPLRVSYKLFEIEQRQIVDSPEEEQFDAALNTLNESDRHAAWDEFVQRIANDSLHLGWQRIDALIDASRHLPMATFDALSALVRNPEAMALIGLRRSHDGWLWERFEELPFLWALVPIADWVRAATTYCRSLRTRLEDAGYDDVAIERHLNKSLSFFAEHARRHWPSAACVGACLHISGLPLELELDEPPVSALLPGNKSSLLESLQVEWRRHVSMHSQAGTPEIWPRARFALLPEMSAIHRGETDERNLNLFEAPLNAALDCVYGTPAENDRLFEFQYARSLDAAWFDKAHEIAMFIFAGQRLLKDHHCFNSKPLE